MSWLYTALTIEHYGVWKASEGIQRCQAWVPLQMHSRGVSAREPASFQETQDILERGKLAFLNSSLNLKLRLIKTSSSLQLWIEDIKRTSDTDWKLWRYSKYFVGLIVSIHHCKLDTYGDSAEDLSRHHTLMSGLVWLYKQRLLLSFQTLVHPGYAHGVVHRAPAACETCALLNVIWRLCGNRELWGIAYNTEKLACSQS